MAALGLGPAVVGLAAGPQFINVELGLAACLLGFPALAALLVVLVVVVKLVAVAVPAAVSALLAVTLVLVVVVCVVFVEGSGVTRSPIPGHGLGRAGIYSVQHVRVVPASQVTGPVLADTQAAVRRKRGSGRGEWSSRPACGKDSKRLQPGGIEPPARPSESRLSWHPRNSHRCVGR